MFNQSNENNYAWVKGTTPIQLPYEVIMEDLFELTKCSRCNSRMLFIIKYYFYISSINKEENKKKTRNVLESFSM